jgi:16S rRNA (guanine527-N7)-methyltransferase
VVNAVAESLGLKNVVGEQVRLTASPLPPSPQGKGLGLPAGQAGVRFHFVVSRAVTELSEFQKWVKNKFLPENFNDLPNGTLYLRGEGEAENKIFELKNYFSEDFFETKKVVFIPSITSL